MKKQWKEPKLVVQQFVPNEYVSACGTLDDGTVLYAANIAIETAWKEFRRELTSTYRMINFPILIRFIWGRSTGIRK